MSTKKVKIMGFDKEGFIKRIDFLVEEHCEGNAAAFNDAIGQRQASYRWRNEGHFPRVEALVKICNKFNVSLDWLLGLSRADDTPQIEGVTPRMELDELKRLLKYYKEISSYYRDLYQHTRELLRPIKDPQMGAGVKADH